MAMKGVPEGHNTVSPYLTVDRAAVLIDFLKQTFDAAELGRYLRRDGTIMHAEVRIGDSVVMIGQAQGEYTPMPSMLHVYVEDADAVYQRALQAGATSIREPADQPEGDRRGGVKDPFGNQWWMATHRQAVDGSSK